eukprot:ctg_4339.g494
MGQSAAMGDGGDRLAQAAAATNHPHARRDRRRSQSCVRGDGRWQGRRGATHLRR